MLIALAALALAACGSGSSGPAIPILYPDFYVNPTVGSDLNDGSYVLPFETITHAMTVAASGEIVQAEPGTYDASNNETFPIRIANGVTLVGDETYKGDGPIQTVIEGMGSFGSRQAAVISGEYSTLAGFLIRTGNTITPDAGAVFVNATGVTVRNSTLTSSYWGLFSDNGPDTVKVQGNIIKSNIYGVDLRHVGMDLGGGSAGSAGRNQIRCNTNNDAYFNLSIGNTASAKSNYWDHSPPTEGLLATDDIYNKYGHTLDTTGFALSPGFCL